MVLELQYAAPQSVIDAIGSLGRTEDVRFSPSNRGLAVASFYRNRVVVFDVDIARVILRRNAGRPHRRRGAVVIGSAVAAWGGLPRRRYLDRHEPGT
jgi:hypothetical protein